MKIPTLLQEVDQFLYTHMQNVPYKQQLRQIVAKWEEAYQARIIELEKADNAGNRMESEGGPARDYSNGFEPRDHFDDDLGGTRYDDFE